MDWPSYDCHVCGQPTDDPHTDPHTGEDLCESCCPICSPSTAPFPFPYVPPTLDPYGTALLQSRRRQDALARTLALLDTHPDISPGERLFLQRSLASIERRAL